SARDDPHRDWYIWRDPAPDGGPPNNWRCTFGGSAWEVDERTGQYYLHSYLKGPPHLNCRNPEVEEAVFSALRFWLERVVDGVSRAAVPGQTKDDQCRDSQPGPDSVPGYSRYRPLLWAYSLDQPGVHEVLGRMRRLAAG